MDSMSSANVGGLCRGSLRKMNQLTPYCRTGARVEVWKMVKVKRQEILHGEIWRWRQATLTSLFMY